MPPRKPDNPELASLVRLLRKTARENDAGIWSRMALSLSKARSRRMSVNLSRINRHSEKGGVVAVPGKVLGAGNLHHPVTIAAYSFSSMARAKVRTAKGKCYTLQELMKQNPKGTNVKIVG